MKNFLKSNSLTKKIDIPFSKNIKSQDPIKCLKSSLAYENQVHLFSPVEEQKYKQFYQKTKTTVLEKKSVNSQEKNKFLSSSLKGLPKANLSQNNWHKRITDNFLKLSNDNASLKLNLSDSLSLSQGKEKDKDKEFKKQSIKLKEVFIPKPKQKNSKGNLNINQQNNIKSKGLNTIPYYNNNNNVNTHSNSNTNTNTNVNSKKMHQKEETNKDMSTFLNYNLGNINNFTQIDSVLFDNNININNNELFKATEADHEDKNEVEINLSKVSIKYDSFLQWGLLHNIKSLPKQNSNHNLFSNNSVYDYDTNEYIEGEQKNEIYSLTIQDNRNKSRPQYCFTETNENKINGINMNGNITGRNSMKREEPQQSYKKWNNNTTIIVNKNLISQTGPKNKTTNDNVVHYKKLPISSSNYIKSSRSFFHIPHPKMSVYTNR